MKAGLKAGDDVRVLWLCAALIVVGAYYLLDTTLQRRIDASRDATASYYARIVANRRIVTEAAQLTSMQRRVDADLAALESHDGETTTSSLLAMLQRNAAKYDVEIEGVEPQKTATALPGADFVSRSLVGQDITVRANSTFADLLLFLQSLSTNGTLFEVTASQVHLAGRTGVSGTKRPVRLQATIQGKLYAVRADAEPLRAAP
jgi:hypothetical protein